jgi:hypothetical protein
MINIDNFQKYFEPIIEVDSNPFQLVSQTTYKENGKLQSKTYEESIEFGERFRLRDPSNKENLENLSESYRLLGNTERSIKILELV